MNIFFHLLRINQSGELFVKLNVLVLQSMKERKKRDNRRIPRDKIIFFQEKLLAWYSVNGRNFLWRKEGLSDYEYIIAEVLLQRTKAETIAKFYPLFLVEFTDWESLATAQPQRIENYLRPVGLYRQRARRLISLACEMVKRKGVLPTDRKELEEIPFMGQYIANAVELVIFNRPSPLLDVNMSRVLERFFGPRDMADIRYDPFLQKLCNTIVKHEKAKEINWAVLDFAAKICQSRKPICYNCVLSTNCAYFMETNTV